MTKEEIGKIIGAMSAPVNVDKIRLETQRLILRPLTWEDFTDIHEICCQEEVAESAGWKASKSEEDSRNRLKAYIEDGETVAIVLKETGKVLGTISLQKRPWHIYPIDRTLRGRELGFDLHSTYWGMGLMPEAVKVLSSYCFDVLGYDFISAGYFRGNEKSRRAIEKCGFSFLFEDDREFPGEAPIHILTHILYNPHKEKAYV